LYITHRLEEVFALADRTTVLQDGQNVGTKSTSELSEATLIQLMVGREISNAGFSGTTRSGKGVLSLRHLGCAASGVSDINLEIRAGEVLGLAGLVGAGRTELARIIFGLTPADAGHLELEGKRVRITSPGQAIADGIAYLPEDRCRHGIILEMSIAQNISMAIHQQLFPGGWLRPAPEKQLANHQIGRLRIKSNGCEAPANSLSGGNQQKVALARWLVTQPKVLILDEPTQGVDIGTKGEIHRLIRDLAQQGVAVLLISSDLPELLAMSDRIGVMRGGKLLNVLPGNSDPQTVMAWALGENSR
jgi:rhamnose transport system ATP-binding protein